jgi:hypothetical protein
MKSYNGATLVPDTQTYRNLALHHPAYASSSYDYNLTALIDTKSPRWVAVSSRLSGTLARKDREHFIDKNPITGVDLAGTIGWVQIERGGGEVQARNRAGL